MGREQDWKEIEKAQLNYEQGIKDQYKGIDIVKISKENRKTIHKIKKINAKADKLVRALLIWYVIFLILLIIFGIHIYIMYLNNIKNRVNIDFIADLKDCYGINAKVIEKDIDKSGNGKYVLKSKEKKPIEFIVIKEFGSYTFDYFDRTLKEEYEKSSDEIKKTFEPHEEYNVNGEFKYNLNSNASSLYDIDNIVHKYVQMRDNAGKHFGYDWNVNINFDGMTEKIWSMGSNEDEESINRRIKCEYVVSKIDGGDNTKFTAEEITRYYKPYSLKVFINGKKVYITIMNQQVQQTALYSYSEEDYTMPISALGEIEEIQIIYDRYSTPLELTFKDKTYKIGGSTVDLENSTIPTYVEVQTLKQIIGAKLEFNYKEQKLNIVVK
ncbi:MAG: hypothetical protein DBY41_10785 [Clostridium sp.]|nr:MAG: hypothetical protein DBY41_10785 [Clostridium sp.]